MTLGWLHCRLVSRSSQAVGCHKLLADVLLSHKCCPEQVLYNRDLTMKLCDFAFSKWKQAGTAQVMSSAVGTPAWMAPEILRGGEYNFKVLATFCKLQPFWELSCQLVLLPSPN